MVVQTADGTNLLKRVLALGGDTVEIADGDVFITRPGEPRRPSPRTIEQMLATAITVATVGDLVLVNAEVRRKAKHAAIVEAGRASVSDEGGHLKIVAESGGAGVVRYPAQGFFDDHRGRRGRRAVRDLAVTLAVSDLSAGVDLVVEHWVRTRGSADATRLATLTFRSRGDDLSCTLEGRPARALSRSDPVRWILFDRMSHLGLPATDGEPSRALSEGVRTAPPGVVESYIRLKITGGSVTLSRLDIARDIHYTSGERDAKAGVKMPYTVPTDSVWVLGDNSPESRDSRELGAFDRADVVGRPSHVVWPPGRMRRLGVDR